jgi:hypothetical protein
LKTSDVVEERAAGQKIPLSAYVKTKHVVAGDRLHLLLVDTLQGSETDYGIERRRAKDIPIAVRWRSNRAHARDEWGWERREDVVQPSSGSAPDTTVPVGLIDLAASDSTAEA